MAARSRTLAAVLLAAQLAGCTSWRVHHLNPRRLITEQRPALALVTRAGRPSVLLERPFITQDSLVGRERWTLKRVAIPLDEVTQIQVRRPDAGKTAALGLGLATGVALLLYLLYLSAVSSPGY